MDVNPFVPRRIANTIYLLMTSYHGYTFHITGHLWWELTGLQWILLTEGDNAGGGIVYFSGDMNTVHGKIVIVYGSPRDKMLETQYHVQI